MHAEEILSVVTRAMSPPGLSPIWSTWRDVDRRVHALEIDSALVARIAQDSFARHLGIEMEELRPGYARLAMTVAPEFVNLHGTCHGGAIFALADAANAAAANSHGIPTVAMSVHIDFLSPGRAGDRLIAEAVEEECSRRTALYHMTVRGAAGQLIASGQGRAYRAHKD